MRAMRAPARGRAGRAPARDALPRGAGKARSRAGALRAYGFRV